MPFRLRTIAALTAAALLALPSLPLRASQNPNRSSSGTDVVAILVDVVVRDRSGEPVTDLRAEEFEIIEDGVEQELGSFTPILKDQSPLLQGTRPAPGSSQAPAAPSSAAAEAAAHADAAAIAAAAANTPGEVLALVFDRLTADNRPLAQKAALQYLGTEPPEGRVMAVYGIDLGLVAYQGLTRDPEKVRRAVERFALRSTSQFGTTSQDRIDLGDRAARSGMAAQAGIDAGAAGGPGAAGQGGGIGAAVADAAFLSMQQRSLETFDALERDQRGYSTANALMAVVSSMTTLPGRKAIVFFSEGLSIPPNAQERFLAVVAAANRANVSIYSVDASGLRTESPLKEARAEIMAAGNRTLRRNPTDDRTSEPMMAALERNETHLRLNPHSGLGLLSDQTGGLLVANTNDFRKALSRVDGDLRNYYMLSYVPKNDNFDGKFRNVSVKVNRSGVSVQHRKGYFAVRAPAGAPVLSYEAPALAMLDRTPVPNTFPVRVAALAFPEASRPGLTPFVVEVPTAGFRFAPVKGEEHALGADVTILARVKKGSGEIIDKMSQHYELRTTPEQLEATRSGEIIFYRQPQLEPGVYTVETIVRDGLTNKASVRFNTVEVPAYDTTKLRMSSLVLLRRSERVPEGERIADSPLYVDDMLLYPNLGHSLKPGADKELGFYFTAYLPETTTRPVAALELLQNAKVLAQVPLELAAPTPQQTLTQVGRIPVDQLKPGTYELRVTLNQGKSIVSRTATFRVS
jgi:VWFA-related protein